MQCNFQVSRALSLVGRLAWEPSPLAAAFTGVQIRLLHSCESGSQACSAFRATSTREG